MSIVIYGGDRLGKIPKLLEGQGFQLIQHVTGRKRGDLKAGIPSGIDGVLVFVDYLNHNLASEIKEAAKRQGIKTVFVKRSWSQIRNALDLFRTAENGAC